MVLVMFYVGRMNVASRENLAGSQLLLSRPFLEAFLGLLGCKSSWISFAYLLASCTSLGLSLPMFCVLVVSCKVTLNISFFWGRLLHANSLQAFREVLASLKLTA